MLLLQWGLVFFTLDCNEIRIDAWAAEYKKITANEIKEQEKIDEKDRIFNQDISGKWPKWIRNPLATEESPKTVTHSQSSKNHTIEIFNKKAELNVIWRPTGKGYLITITIINKTQQKEESSIRTEDCLFQVGFRCSLVNGSIREYQGSDKLAFDEEEEELALQYKKKATFAVGHGCAPFWSEDIKYIQTSSLPTSEVKPVTNNINNEKAISLKFLSDESIDADILRNKLNAFTEDYRVWFKKISKEDVQSDLKKAKERILARVNKAHKRMLKGITEITTNPEVKQAFAIMNNVMMRQMIHTTEKEFVSLRNRDEIDYNTIRPSYDDKKFEMFKWRPFQLGFLLVAIESLVNPNSEDRDVVDLIWFPTGGGKTEAYLGLAAFELIYRRLKFGQKGAGTSVIKRYTLRLLTAQQFQRASTLISCLELIRKEREALLGETSFTLGLFVGENTSPNKFNSENDKFLGAYQKYKALLNEERPKNEFALLQCPLCGTKIVPDKKTEDEKDYGIVVTQSTFSFFCPTSSCDLHQSIPVTVVDDDIFRKPPSFIIGTIDKFARLAWDSQAKNLFGGDENRPPSLIIQDELHLISGPLGTITGVYEAAIETVIISNSKEKIKPKYIAATATIRRANEQVKKLYGRTVDIFPPPGLSSDDSYFARTNYDALGRLYIGIMNQGHTQDTSLVRLSAALSQSVLECQLSEEAKDTWWTQIIYHNSRRELGKSMTKSKDDIPKRVRIITSDEKNRRKLANVEELSGSRPAFEIPQVLSKLEKKFNDDAIDILPCTNMISVGVDVSRLGLMLIFGQPKTTSEYIQASSRVGRSDKYPPGIVVTLYSPYKPRDRSHYENFNAYHKKLYRAVEPTSVTPFAYPSRIRSLHAALVIVMRHAAGLGGDDKAQDFKPLMPETKEIIKTLEERMCMAEPEEEVAIKEHIKDLVKEWVKKTETAEGEKYKPLYYDGGRQYKKLLSRYDQRNPEGWSTLNSMRNIDLEAIIKVTGGK
ncbi:helicase-related protein [Nitrosomonadales bacterium]|nr:helicase-related protein [Nitrosomonadales bacterium]